MNSLGLHWLKTGDKLLNFPCVALCGTLRRDSRRRRTMVTPETWCRFRWRPTHACSCRVLATRRPSCGTFATACANRPSLATSPTSTRSMWVPFSRRFFYATFRFLTFRCLFFNCISQGNFILEYGMFCIIRKFSASSAWWLQAFLAASVFSNFFKKYPCPFLVLSGKRFSRDSTRVSL